MAVVALVALTNGRTVPLTAVKLAMVRLAAVRLAPGATSSSRHWGMLAAAGMYKEGGR